MKLCIECRHHRPPETKYSVDQCARRIRINPVTGKQDALTCATERLFVSTSTCGPDGRFFVAKAIEERAA